MLQAMIDRLDNSLQNKILMYCLGSPCATIMKPICALVKDNSDSNEATAFRYYNAPHGNKNRYRKCGTFLALCVIEDLRMIKEKKSILKVLGIRVVENLYKNQFLQKYTELTKKEENGTPTCVIIRKYITNLLSSGFKLMDNETMCVKFSCGQLSTRRHKPLLKFKDQMSGH